MKNLWKKTPAWLKAILLNLVLLFPVIFINQNLIFTNVAVTPEIGWALIPCVLVLFGYWKIVTRLNPFRGSEDNRLELRFNLKSPSSWAGFFGISLFIFSLLNIMLMFVPVEESLQVQLIQQFSVLTPATAIPLLLALALTAGVVEEVTYRGYMQNVLRRSYPAIPSYIIVGVLFSLVHLLPWKLMIPYVLVSIMFSVVAGRERSIGLVIFTHIVFDFLMFLKYYFNVLDLTATTTTNILINGILLLTSVLLIAKKKQLPFKEPDARLAIK